MKALKLALIACLAAGSAQAALHPKYYEEGRRNAANVVVIAVKKVSPPLLASYGDCKVKGQVLKVERGTKYRVGETIVIVVPCAKPSADVPVGGVLWTELEPLKRSAHGKAYLDDAGKLVMSQYELYDLH